MPICSNIALFVFKMSLFTILVTKGQKEILWNSQVKYTTPQVSLQWRGGIKANCKVQCIMEDATQFNVQSGNQKNAIFSKTKQFRAMVYNGDLQEVAHGLFKEPITGPLKSNMVEIRHLGS